MELRSEPSVWYAGDRRFGEVANVGARALHHPTEIWWGLAPNPDECREHFAAGRLPVYYGRKLVAYVDEPVDLPEARFVERDGRLMGSLNVWDLSADRFAA